MIETGCRPSELSSLSQDTIILDHEVLHILIRPTSDRQLKSKSSMREIPLVGVSLAAMKKTPNGFPHYRDKGNLLSGSLMNAFRVRSLFPTEMQPVSSRPPWALPHRQLLTAPLPLAVMGLPQTAWAHSHKHIDSRRSTLRRQPGRTRGRHGSCDHNADGNLASDGCFTGTGQC